MKIIVASDNHGNFNAIRKILIDNPNADYYWHLGDSCFDDLTLLRPFISINGNNDYNSSLPNQRIIELGNFRFLLIHGHRQLSPDMEYFVKYAKEANCNIVLYGHTHIFDNRIIEGIHFINPGSCSFNRDGDEPTYCLIEINNNELNVTKKYV